jgi:hypothetical protein
MIIGIHFRIFLISCIQSHNLTIKIYKTTILPDILYAVKHGVTLKGKIWIDNIYQLSAEENICIYGRNVTGWW